MSDKSKETLTLLEIQDELMLNVKCLPLTSENAALLKDIKVIKKQNALLKDIITELDYLITELANMKEKMDKKEKRKKRIRKKEKN